MDKVKTKRGYLSSFNNYYDWFVSHDLKWQRDHMVRCQHCGRKFVPKSPNQKYCGPENNMCYATRTDAKMADGMWIKNATKMQLVPFAEK